MSACDAIMVAKVERISIGKKIGFGTSLKNGLAIAAGSLISNAAWER